MTTIETTVADAEAEVAAAQAKLDEAKKVQAAAARAARQAKIDAHTTKPGESLVWVNGQGEPVTTAYAGARAYIQVGDIDIQIAVSQGWTKDDRKKARLYVSGNDDVDYTEAYAMQAANREAHLKATGSTYYERGVFPEEDKLFRKLNRLELDGMRRLIDQAISESPEFADVLRGVKLHFSRYAGCSCPCSSGFIASSHIKLPVGDRLANVTNIWVSRKEVAA